MSWPPSHYLHSNIYATDRYWLICFFSMNSLPTSQYVVVRLQAPYEPLFSALLLYPLSLPPLQFGTGLTKSDLSTLKGKAINVFGYILKAVVFDLIMPRVKGPWPGLRQIVGLKPYRSYPGQCLPELHIIMTSFAIEEPRALKAGKWARQCGGRFYLWPASMMSVSGLLSCVSAAEILQVAHYIPRIIICFACTCCQGGSVQQGMSYVGVLP